MNNTTLLNDEQFAQVIKLSAETGAKTAIEHVDKEQAKRKRLSAERRVEDTKQLLRNFRIFAGIAEQAVYTISTPEMYRAELEALMTPGRYESIVVESIKENALRSEIMCAHIRAAMQSMQRHFEKFGTRTDRRRWRVTYKLYISMDEPRMTAQEIAEEEGLADESSIYRDFNEFCKIAVKYIFGVSAVLDDRTEG